MPFKEGPFVQVACICETAINDKTNTISLIRVIDTITQRTRGNNPSQDMPPITFQGKLVIMLKSGRAQGRHELNVIPELPSGETQNPITLSVHFDGEEKGANLISNLNYTFTQEGLHWFRVYVDGEVLTAIPLRVKYERIVTSMQH